LVITFRALGPVCCTGWVGWAFAGTVARAVCIAGAASKYIAIITGFKLRTGLSITAGGAAAHVGTIRIAGTASIGIAVVANFSVFNHAVAATGHAVVIVIGTASCGAAAVIAYTSYDEIVGAHHVAGFGATGLYILCASILICASFRAIAITGFTFFQHVITAFSLRLFFFAFLAGAFPGTVCIAGAAVLSIAVVACFAFVNHAISASSKEAVGSAGIDFGIGVELSLVTGFAGCGIHNAVAATRNGAVFVAGF
jgi:hypothetical protein